MSKLKSCLATLLPMLVLALGVGAARADDTEVFFNQNSTGAAANVMLILDTSGSMSTSVSTASAYSASTTYTSDSNCDSTAYYYVAPVTKGRTTTYTPACSSTNKITSANFQCYSGLSALSSSGYYNDTFIRLNTVTTVTTGNSTSTSYAYGWSATLADSATTSKSGSTTKVVTTTGTYIECKTDAGKYGYGTDTTKPYPAKGSLTAATTSVAWTASSGSSWWGTGTTYTIYSGNYVNWYLNSVASTSTRLAIMQAAVTSLLGSVTNVNVGVMRYNKSCCNTSSNDTQTTGGGMVVVPVGDVSTNASSIESYVNSWTADGSTPLEETLYEAYRYFAGLSVYYGANSTPTVSAASSRTGGVSTSSTYDSPSDSSCQKNFIIFLTDGQPNEGSSTLDTTIKSLTDFSTDGGTCLTSEPTTDSVGGLCLGALAQYMYNHDLRSDVSGTQNVTTYFIGFGSDFSTGTNATDYYNYLSAAATAGGGAAYTASSLTDLSSVFTSIFSEVQKTNTTFTAPSVAVNAFNRTETLSDLYVSVFSPKTTYHWPGNIKKYKLVGGVITDANGDPAVDKSTGFTSDDAVSYWTTSLTDGQNVQLGGAAENIPVATSRTVYTYIGTNPAGKGKSVDLTACSDSQCLFSTDNAKLTTTLLGVNTATDPATARTTLINYSRGEDVNDVDSDSDTTERYSILDTGDADGDGSTSDYVTAPIMGDPIHAQPAVVIYSENDDDDLTLHTVVYTTTNDGYLHAINAASGKELWAFIPQEMLGRLESLYTNESASDVTEKTSYGLDGQVQVLKYDVDGDGAVESADGDRVLIFFGTGRSTSASAYYAMDVTDPTTPKLLWVDDTSILSGLGQAWSTPTVGRFKVSGATENSQNLVLFVGGGYASSEDDSLTYAADSVGAHVYMLDALYGTVLWSAGSSSSDSFVSSSMTHAIPSTLSVLDVNDDGYSDRLYFGDMGGQLWRIDLTSGLTAANAAVGGVMASLGGSATANYRRFYSAPDVAEVTSSGSTPYFNIALGSGYRGHPLSTSVQDRLYGIRDYNAYTIYNTSSSTYNQTAFNKLTVLADSDLQTTSTSSGVTTTSGTVYGWKIPLMSTSSTWVGEKSLTPAATSNNIVYFTTYTPNTDTTTSTACSGVGSGTNKVYEVNLASGKIVTTVDLAQGGIASEVAFTETLVDSSGASCTGASCLVQEVIFSGQEKVGSTTSQQLYKTYWHDGSAN
ncbi:MAG: PilC/PilY family type IV pilus protein [Steroidobacteraceae bacterium]